MALNQFSRTQLLLGQESMDLLADATVAVFGIGGVGGYTVEALARSGVGHFVLVDDDKVCLTNINRQIIATRSSVGKYKVDVMKERILDINPKAEVETYKCFYLPENAEVFVRCRCCRYGNGKDRDHHARQSVQRAGHQLYGSRKQTGSDEVPCGRYLQDEHVPAGKGHAA